MRDDLSTRLSLLTRREVEARILAPLLEAVAEECGEDKTLGLLHTAITRIACEQGRALAARLGGNSLTDFARSVAQWTQDDALEIEVLEQTGEVLAFNVTRCCYAEMYEALGLRSLGRTLSCARDAAMVRGFNPEIELHRTQTIMEGAAHCDFVYRLRR
jgi:hypothetical protein